MEMASLEEFQQLRRKAVALRDKHGIESEFLNIPTVPDYGNRVISHIIEHLMIQYNLADKMFSDLAIYQQRLNQMSSDITQLLRVEKPTQAAFLSTKEHRNAIRLNEYAKSDEDPLA
ncbi:hypothetical protein Dda_4071 [Drechslerella dactyloides]|uniref:Uncharacterized protein n=1 Tax=Drechslerella dactyloides TaxID=74499 RepID=A0AAD6NJ37_DREDA|nr:hypothetical protein Dda_4071 [Drechslerella dactyloides]